MASRGINKVILVGNLGKDPETRYFPNGGAVTNVVLATSESWKDKQTGENQERTEWHKISFFNRLAEISGEYLRKGSKVYIEGKLQTRKWQDQSGNDRYTTEIIAYEMQMLDSKQSMEQGNFDAPPPMQPSDYTSNGYASTGGDSNSQSSSNYAPKPQAQQPAPAMSGADDLDDDIPF